MLKPTISQLELMCHQTHNTDEIEFLEYNLYNQQGIILIDAGSKQSVLINLLKDLTESHSDIKRFNKIDKRINQIMNSKSDNFVRFNSLSVRDDSGLNIVRPYKRFIYYDCKKIIINPEW